ncbi:sigma-70 family RNA polymerase sigma factor [Streptomyces antnestii]|uniref:Sigma-70 family RNA polymerase sigma factor n=1 Tax=Streptomyces antnestii TaxID=2494256 RepID=A0A3S2W496_9ACTN|nr:sigma-70 family RNA polymerase sigma factor [Streptomyces sp. San01]RVU27542.1 sigma-70 family RNA polymerase sigma factor [Streptomyces sp. San01]
MSSASTDTLAERFEESRGHLRAVAYRMLGSIGEAEDAVQETWLRLQRTDTSTIENLGGWLTTVTGRICLDALRSRKSRAEEPLDTHVPDPLIASPDTPDPEQQALQADSVGLALLIVLDSLAPAERLAFVLHDMFAVPFDDIAPIVERTPAATRQLASRARRRVQGAPAPETDIARQRVVVEAFLSAAREGDFERLVAVLDPDILLRADGGATGVSRLLQGAHAVASGAIMFQRMTPQNIRFVVVNGTIGLLSLPDGRATSLMAFTITNDRVTELNVVADEERLAALGF